MLHVANSSARLGRALPPNAGRQEWPTQRRRLSRARAERKQTVARSDASCRGRAAASVEPGGRSGSRPMDSPRDAGSCPIWSCSVDRRSRGRGPFRGRDRSGMLTAVHSSCTSDRTCAPANVAPVPAYPAQPILYGRASVALRVGIDLSDGLRKHRSTSDPTTSMFGPSPPWSRSRPVGGPILGCTCQRSQ